jgi:sugar phosphate isomerase/epimerase
MYLGELDLPFDESLAKAREIGAESVWFNVLKGETPIGKMTDAEADRMAERVARHGLTIFLFNAGNPFKEIHLTEFSLQTIDEHPRFREQLADLTRSMEIARRIGVRTVGSFSFAWPGEYSAGKPTWPMRWATRGGIISENEFEKLVKAFTIVMERAERHGVDVALAMMPWNYTNTTGNFRRLAERLGSKRIKLMWGPADNWNCGEWDVATNGFANVRPFLHGLHLKDLHVIDGTRLKFEYRPLGEGDVDYVTIFRNLRAQRCDAVLSVSTHFRPASGSREEAMRINYRNVRELIRKAEAEG